MHVTQCTTDDIMNTIVLVLSFPVKRYPYCRKKISRFSRLAILEILTIFCKCHVVALVINRVKRRSHFQNGKLKCNVSVK